MFSFLETLVILIVAVLVFGPKRLPEVARKVGNWMGMLRRASDEFKQQLMTMDQAVENAVSVPEEDLDSLLPNEQDLYGIGNDGSSLDDSGEAREPYIQPPPPQGEDETSPDAAAAWLDGTDDEDTPESYVRDNGLPEAFTMDEQMQAADVAAAANVTDESAAQAPVAESRPVGPRKPTLTPTKPAAKEAAHV